MADDSSQVHGVVDPHLGGVHWVQASKWCNNVAWNVGPKLGLGFFKSFKLIDLQIKKLPMASNASSSATSSEVFEACGALPSSSSIIINNLLSDEGEVLWPPAHPTPEVPCTLGSFLEPLVITVGSSGGTGTQQPTFFTSISQVFIANGFVVL